MSYVVLVYYCQEYSVVIIWTYKCSDYSIVDWSTCIPPAVTISCVGIEPASIVVVAWNIFEPLALVGYGILEV